ncbi:MAG TPA: hypothetical protein PLT68_01065 [Actinomycetota bacterium]|nr:hypothetical protein [Actinomycetota bacterium]
MAGLVAAGLAAVMGVAVMAPVGDAEHGRNGPMAPAAVSAKTGSPRQSPVDADYYLMDASGHWAAPRCLGNGRSGPRVQPVFVYRLGQKNRYSRFRVVLNRSMALTTGIVERSSGTQRTVRWVHDATCQPVVWQVGVPAGYTHDLVSLRRYLSAADTRFRRTDRVYSLWVDSTTSPSWSGLGGDRWSATWSSSWGFVWVDAHEMIHAIGAVRGDAPHATGKGHCYDGYDVMCYSDGGATWRKVTVCPRPEDQFRLDCRDDDYFAVTARRGSWLARHPGANVANSRFLAQVAPRPLPVEPPAPTGVRRDAFSVRWDMSPGVRYDVGTRDADGSIIWLGQDVTGGGYPLLDLSPQDRVFVRAVNDAGYSIRVRAVSG